MLWQVARCYPLQIFLTAVSGFSGALFNGIGTALIVPIMLSLLGQDAILKEGPPIFQVLLSPFVSLPELPRLLAMAISALALIVLKNVCNYWSGLTSGILSRSLTSDLQRQGLDLILTVDLEYFSQAQVGELMNRLGGEMNRAVSAITTIIRLGITIITILVFLGLLLAISWQLTIVATLLLPLSSLVSQFLVRRSRGYSRALTRLNGEYSGGLVELISGIRLVKSTVNETREHKRFSDNIRQREALNYKIQANSGLVAPLGEVINLTVLFTLVLLARFLFRDQIGSLAAVMVTYLVLLSRLLPFIGQLNGARNQLAQVSASVDVTYDLLRRDNKSFMPNGAIPYQGLTTGIEFRHVSFAYPNTPNRVLSDVQLTLPKGTTLALVGSSGAGKSTLADLLPRYFDPIEGAILLDGRDLRDYDIATVRQAMGIVGQETFLFNNTVRYNIAYGNPTATEKDIIDAARRANAYEFIAQLPNRLDTMIGDRGVMLSGGQRQRLAIARALVQDPEILILDEATSALDTVSERLVQEAIDELSRDRTTLVIAHRLSTVQKADQIAVMEKGQVIELGTHESLLKQGGTYSKLCHLQFDTGQTENSGEADNQRLLTELYYNCRAHLNSMMGLLSILNEGLVETEEERAELTEKIFTSTQNLIIDLEKVESPKKIRSEYS
jgi:ABC-type multidrug transport system fused ATPase/permease subunit